MPVVIAHCAIECAIELKKSATRRIEMSTDFCAQRVHRFANGRQMHEVPAHFG